MEIYPSAQSPSPKENFVNAIKRLLENRNLTFPLVRYFKRKLEFFSNILSAVVLNTVFSRPRPEKNS